MPLCSSALNVAVACDHQVVFYGRVNHHCQGFQVHEKDHKSTRSQFKVF